MGTNANQRLTILGVPEVFHADIAARKAPRFHTLVHLSIVLISLAGCVAALVAWSRYVATAAFEAATSSRALLYDSDIGAELLGLLLTVLLAAGWLCGAITWRRGSENARGGWATDILHEPAKHRAIVNWLWRQMIRRYSRGSTSADDFLDRLGRGIVRDLRNAAFVMLAVTIGLGAIIPARISYLTDTTISERPVLPYAWRVTHKVAGASVVVSGCPSLPKDGNTLFYQLQFADGAEANLGAWQTLESNKIAALEAVATNLPPKIVRLRFNNPIGSEPLSSACLKEFGSLAGTNGIRRILRLLAVTDTEKGRLAGL